MLFSSTTMANSDGCAVGAALALAIACAATMPHAAFANDDALREAIAGGNVETVSTMIAGGADVGPAHAGTVLSALDDGLATACQMQPVPSDRIAAMLTLLTRHGFPIGFADPLGNTVLLSAAQFCPASVVRAVLDDGAPPAPLNRQHFTPLMMAFVSGKWDAASVLVDHGARLTRTQSSQIFFAPPTDPVASSVLARATR